MFPPSSALKLLSISHSSLFNTAMPLARLHLDACAGAPPSEAEYDGLPPGSENNAARRNDTGMTRDFCVLNRCLDGGGSDRPDAESVLAVWGTIRPRAGLRGVNPQNEPFARPARRGGLSFARDPALLSPRATRARPASHTRGAGRGGTSWATARSTCPWSSSGSATVVPVMTTMPMVVAPPRTRPYPGGAVICSGRFSATIKPTASASTRGVLGECRSRDDHAERECHTGQDTNEPCAHEDLT